MSLYETDGHGAWADDNNHKWNNTLNDPNQGKKELNDSTNERLDSALNSNFNELSLNDESGGNGLFGNTVLSNQEMNIFDDQSNQRPDILEQSVWEERNTLNLPTSEPLASPMNILSDDNNDKLNNQTSIGDDMHNEDLNDWIKSTRKLYNPLSLDIVTTEEIPEREGLLFKHINYKLVHLVELPNTDPSDDKSVIRRYSDFSWLQEVLLKRYPFRIIPELPPKKIGTSQNLDPMFLKRRLNGLHNFINLIMKHPILKGDDLVLTFLTVPTDLSTWRKQLNNRFDTVDEFQNRKITKDFIKLWKPEISQHLNNVANSLESMLEIWTKINFLVQRSEKRLKQKIHENYMMNNLISELQTKTTTMYPIDIDEGNNRTVLDINNNLSIINKHISDLTSLNEKEILLLTSELLPKFKIYIDILIALKNMFDRYKIMATNNIPQLQRHIELDMGNLESMKGKPDSSGTEFDRLRLSIKKDQHSIVQQLNRSWLIRQCILFEFSLYQETQFLVSSAFNDWVKLNSNFTELNMNEWEKLSNQIGTMSISDDT